MANLTRDLVWKVNGIWHLDRTAIEDFDNRIDAIVGLVEKHRKYLIDKHIDEKLKYLQQLRKSDKSAAPSPDEEKTLKSQARKEVQRANALRLKNTKRRLTLRFRNSKAIEMARLGEAVGHLDLAEEMPVSFEQDVQGPDISLKITFDSKRNEILIDRSYHDTALTRKAFISVDQWREEHRITGWVSAWGRIRQFPEVAFFIALIFLFVGLSLPFSLAGRPADAGLSTLRAEAHKLLSNGLSEPEERRALELVLAMMAGAEPKPVQPLEVVTSPGFVSGSVMTAVCLVVLLWAPRSAIGIGRGQAAIKSQQARIEFAKRFLPAAIFVDILYFLFRAQLLSWVFRQGN